MIEGQPMFSERFNMWHLGPTLEEVVEVMDGIIFRHNPDDVGSICCIGLGDQPCRAKQAESKKDSCSVK
jgi:hypothetical protein